MSDKQERSQPVSNSTVGGRIWTFLRILNVRLRFILLMVVVGLVAGNWDDIMNHYDRWRRPAKAPEALSEQAVEYYCPMHPKVIQAQPGNCPICGMPLVERAKTAAKALPEGVLAQVEMTPQKVALGRIETAPVQYQMLAREIRTVGQIDPTEKGRAFVSARISGRIDKLFVNYTGQKIRKNEPMVDFYSPELLVAEEELLMAARAARGQPQTRPTALVAQTAQAQLVAARKKLEVWGMTPAQIDEIIARGAASDRMMIHSPVTGTVVEKKVLEGQYVTPGYPLYTVVDLGTVWMQVKVFVTDMGAVSEGESVEVSTSAWPNEIFAARIAFISYKVDPDTQTVDARIEIDNPEAKLKPGMYADAVIRVPVGKVTIIQPMATQSAPAHQLDTGPLAKAYLKLVAAYALDKADAAALVELVQAAKAVAGHGGGAVGTQSSVIAEQAAKLQGKDLKEQRALLKALSGKVIDFLKAHPPPGQELYVVHCPMVKADWLSAKSEVLNPYYGSQMLRCGEVTGRIQQTAAKDDERYATGYYCPILPDRLYESPGACPIDAFPMKYVRIEKVLAVPEMSVIDTGTRKIVYRESAPGVFEMVEVKLGHRAGEFYPLLQGVKAGERIATRGAFLVDAENRLNPAVSATYFGASGGPSGGGGNHGGH